MRSHQNVVQRRKGQPAGFALARLGRVLVPDVDRGASDASSAKRIEQRLLVDHGTTSDVHQHRARLHSRKLWRADEAPGFAAQRHTYDDVLRALQELLKTPGP